MSSFSRSLTVQGASGFAVKALGIALKSYVSVQVQADTKEAVAEARLRLLAGLKRYFHSKAAEGLLSGTVCMAV